MPSLVGDRSYIQIEEKQAMSGHQQPLSFSVEKTARQGGDRKSKVVILETIDLLIVSGH